MAWDDLKGKKALVTGASSGLGLHFAQLLARQGMEVVLGARRREKNDEAARAIRDGGGRARSVVLNVRDCASIRAAVAESGPIDVLVNNAGVTATAPLLDLEDETLDAILDTNLHGVIQVAIAVARQMRGRGQGGAIVNIASILGLRVASQVSPYAVSKAGVIQFTETAALEWARYGIRVNALCPGYIKTPLNADFFATPAGEAAIKRIPQRRLGTPEDLDGPLLLLASNAGRFMTGTALVADGGHLISSL